MILTFNGLRCDNEECGYNDDTIPYEQFSNQINKGCPKCGEVWYTEEDHRKCTNLVEYVTQHNINNPNEDDDTSKHVHAKVDIRNETMTRDEDN